MNDTLTISNQPVTEKALNYASLRKLAISYLEQAASANWTDFNVHDPGITTLELLCYAITDISYRSQFSIPDLLHGKDDKPGDIIALFHTAAKIFPNKSLTINDYRRLLIDVAGVKNAWLKMKTKNITADLTNKQLTREAPANTNTKQVAIKGYYDVLLEFDTTIKDEDAQKQMIGLVSALLQENRNLDEDFDQVGKVPQQSFRLCAEMEIEPAVNPFDLLAQIFFRVQLYLSPLVRFYSLQQMLDAGYTSDEIFEGTFISHGFIKEQELIDSELKTEIHLSDIMQIILDISGVKNINDIIFNDVNESESLINKWVIGVNEGCQPVVDILQSNIVLYKNGIPFRPDPDEVKIRFEAMMKDYLQDNENIVSEDIRFDTGNYLGVDAYYSFQHHYPKTYGISLWGLPEDATIERKKQARQLQGYLWFFDQLLANYMKQLASLKNTFSLEDEKNTYFSSLVNDFKDADEIFVDKATISSAIQVALENNELFVVRRNRFLDHLLNRFSESFYDYASILSSLFPSLSPLKIIDAKRTFLKQYPAYSGERGKAYNYGDKNNLWDSDNISGFEKRVGRLLGFENIKRRTLVNIYFKIQEDSSVTPAQYWFEIIDNHSGKIILQAKDKQTDKTTAEGELEIALTLAAAPANFKLNAVSPGVFNYTLNDKLNNVVATGIDASEADAKASMTALLQGINNMSEEGMFLVEHLLLFGDTVKSFLPVCVDENCDECSETDPYSFRVSIVLPAFTPRFMNIDFRMYAELVMREEIPSHLLPKVCWVSNEQLQQFEKAYKEWLDVRAGAKSDEDGSILKDFIGIFTSLRNVYPQTRLADCSNKEERQLFLLNKNSLGTQKTT